MLPPSTIIGSYEEVFSNTDAAAGVVETSFAVVPPGEIWIIEAASCWDATTSITSTAITLTRGGANYTFTRWRALATYDGVHLDHAITLFPGDCLKFTWVGCVLHDDIFARALGIKLGIELF
jgi:hypothetical protein